jgi:hypothetical protein
LCEICGAQGDASEDSNLLDRKIRRNHYIVYFEIETKFWSSGEMQRCRVLKVTQHLAFRYRVCYLGYRQEATEVWKGYAEVKRRYSKGPSTLRNARDDVTVRRSNCWIACCIAFPAPQSSRRAYPSSVRWTVVKLVLRVRSCDYYTFSAWGICLRQVCSLHDILPAVALECWCWDNGGSIAADWVVATPFCSGVQEQQWTPQNKSPSPEADSRSPSHEIPLIL